MPEFPQILTTPTTIPEKVYDRYWITDFRVSAPDPNRSVSVNVRLRKGSKDQSGTWSLQTGVPHRNWSIPDLFAACENDTELAYIVGALIDKIGRMTIALDDAANTEPPPEEPPPDEGDPPPPPPEEPPPDEGDPPTPPPEEEP